MRKGDQAEPPTRTYGYDGLSRLTSVKDGATDTLLQGYGYDATGNRTSATVGGTATPYTYAATNHRLGSIGNTARLYDAVGNTTKIGSGGQARSYVFDATNRLSQSKDGNKVAMNYAYNGKGEQVRRYPTTTSTAQTYALYDEAGHVVGSYDVNGARLQEVIWLDDLPVGVIASSRLHYVQADHLGTPRVIIDPVIEKAVWTWDMAGEAFGVSAPNQDPDANSTFFVFDLRFPGQRYDSASGLNYNYFRDYETGAGRYVESDPIGLGSGPSTYAYAGGSPLRWVDSDGLAYFAKRPLNNNEWFWMGAGSCQGSPLDDRLNTEVSHEHIFFEDGKAPSNVGFGKNGLFTESSSAGYRCRSGKYNDCLMRKAVANSPPRRPYCLLGAPGSKQKYNCQDWADDVRTEYTRLTSDPAARKECGLCD